MTAAFSRFGNELHTGERSYPLVRRRRWFYAASAILLIVLGTITLVRGPNLGIEFTGGSEFQVAGVHDPDQALARTIVREHVPEGEPKITTLGGSTLRIQTEQLDSDQTTALAQDLAESYRVPAQNVSSSYVGPTWGSDVTFTALRAVIVFLVLVGAVMALYFRNLKASIAAMLALVHDMLLTAVAYGAIGFEITPATVIGFLTILGYSIYDTVVVFDKVRENTEGILENPDLTFEEAVERAANQTLVRSINTSVVALLPVGSILVIGSLLLGAGTLKDISLSLFVGILAGTYSSIFLAPGFLVDLRRREPALRAHDEEVLARRAGTAPRARRRARVPARAGAPAGGRQSERRRGERGERDEPGQREEPESRADADELDAADDLDVPAEPRDPDSETGGPTSRPGTARQQPRRTTRRRRTSSRPKKDR